MQTEKKKRKRRHTLKMILMPVIALAAGVLVGELVENAAMEYLLNRMAEPSYYEQQLTGCMERLEAFIEENQVTSDHLELLLAWAQKESDVYVMFYRDADAVFNPYLTEEDENGQEVYRQLEYYDVMLADGTTIKAEMDLLIEGKYFYMVDFAALISGGLVFLLVLLLLIRREIRYVNRLEQQIQRDEEERANAELVTAMSHDLRTPLTSLIGYLELLAMHKYKDEEQLQEYLEHCRDKAFQLKKMSDRLFEYFLVYGKRDQQYELQEITCAELVEDLCNGQFFDWQQEGGALDCQIEELKGSVKVDGEYLQRVIDNLISNLKKYGDLAYPLEIQGCERQEMLHLLLSNHVREQENRIESTQIGLKTCRKIIEAHGGNFEWEHQESRFTITLELPLLKTKV